MLSRVTKFSTSTLALEIKAPQFLSAGILFVPLKCGVPDKLFFSNVQLLADRDG
jgi:hypothetical protein